MGRRFGVARLMKDLDETQFQQYSALMGVPRLRRNASESTTMLQRLISSV